MSLLGNLIWLLFGGLEFAIVWCFMGIVYCITIVGIPLGRQCFKFAALSLAPFGSRVVYGGGAPSVIANIIWFCFTGLWMALGYLMVGLIYCITIVGIPFGKQLFKFAKLSLFPFGASVL